MRIQIEATPYFTDLDGVVCRAWNGVTESGIGCVVFVHRLMVKSGTDQVAFDVELAELPAPRRIEDAVKTGGESGR